MRIYLMSRTPMKISLFLCLATFVLVALTGFRDFKKEGVACTLQARIVDIEKPPPDQKVLVVQKILHTQAKSKEKLQKIYVIVTKETIIGPGGNMKFEDLHLEMAVKIEGLKVVEREQGQDNTVVLAKKIILLVE